MRGLTQQLNIALLANLGLLAKLEFRASSGAELSSRSTLHKKKSGTVAKATSSTPVKPTNLKKSPQARPPKNKTQHNAVPHPPPLAHRAHVPRHCHRTPIPPKVAEAGAEAEANNKTLVSRTNHEAHFYGATGCNDYFDDIISDFEC
ncbi:hypothetical protein EJ02DRAFT_497095 [Clathrospora elynae]|uniref:Uncharacterized protein n=1 Tax=Clathrospora elynae TaxID=706981 RepID=A0A6A5SFN2_9PLEO|nr:hypothetical protein EJ02DRAFT_497095 [Clathrospora elynae]